MRCVRGFVLLAAFSSLGCSGLGDSKGANADLASSGTGCSQTARGLNKPGLPFDLTPIISKWNLDVSNETGVLAKNDSGERVIPMGTGVVLALNNSCVGEGRLSAPMKELLQDSEVDTKKMQRGLQSYHKFSLDRGYSRGELYQIVMLDSCVITLETPKTLKHSAFPTDPGVVNQPYWQSLSYKDVYDSFFDPLTGITASVTVAVIDTGIDLDHQDLVGAIWVNDDEIAGNGIDDDGNGYIDDINGYHFVDDLGDPDPPTQFSAYNTHGTAVAGLIGSVQNSVGIVGVMPSNIKLMSLNTFGENAGSSIEDVASAIDYAIQNGAKVINLSLAGKISSTTIQAALVSAAANGVVVVVAAGNEYEEITASNFYAPIGYAKDIGGVIGVGASFSSSKRIADYSNFNTEYVEIAAPGSESKFVSSFIGLYTLDVNSTYGRFDGTSFAAPLVAGAAALTYAYLASKGSPPTPAQIEQLLLSSSDQLLSLDGKIKQCRHLNLKKLFEAL
jgi:hypothetical protein